MNRPRIEQHLTQVDQDIVRDAVRIARQHEIIAELERGGHDSTPAVEQLAVLEETQRQHAETRRQVEELLHA